jgi:hypothetical protein
MFYKVNSKYNFDESLYGLSCLTAQTRAPEQNRQGFLALLNGAIARHKPSVCAAIEKATLLGSRSYRLLKLPICEVLNFKLSLALTDRAGWLLSFLGSRRRALSFATQNQALPTRTGSYAASYRRRLTKLRASLRLHKTRLRSVTDPAAAAFDRSIARPTQ